MNKRVWLVCGVFLGLYVGGSLSHAGAETQPQPVLEDLLPGYQIARCLFSEGKLVLEHDAKFLVLREGDILPGRSEVRVLEIQKTRAVLAESALPDKKESGPAPRRLILIDQAVDGGVEISLLSAQLPVGEDLTPERTALDGLFVPGADGAPPNLGIPVDADAKPFRDESSEGGEQ